MAMHQKRFKVIWRIENAKIWFETRNDALYSHQFRVKTLADSKWRLKLSTNWGPTEKYISLAIQRDHLEDDGPDLLELDYELSFLSGAGESLKSKRWTKEFDLQTVSHELNVRQVHIFEKEKEAYLPEGVLIVCCKMLGKTCSFAMEGQCSIESKIGVKNIIMQGNINIQSQNQTVNFTSTSPEIRLISFNLLISMEETEFMRLETFNFKMIHIEGNRFNWISSELSFFLKSGRNITCKASSNVPYPHIEFNVIIAYIHDLILSPTNQQAPVELKMTYFPGVISERVEYKIKNQEERSHEKLLRMCRTHT